MTISRFIRMKDGKRLITVKKDSGQSIEHIGKPFNNPFEARLGTVPTVPYIDPWNTSFEERLASLVKGDVRAAYFCEVPENTTFRYRVYNMIQALRESEIKIAASYFTADELPRINQIDDLADVLVISRFRCNNEINRLIDRAKNKGVRVLFDVDDLVIDPRYLDLLLQTIDQAHVPGARQVWYDMSYRIGATMSLCDAVITTNQYLASKITESLGKPVYIIPNYLNKEQIAISDIVYNAKQTNPFTETDKIYLGYFPGTPSHNNDFAIIANTVISLFERDPRIELIIVGILTLHGDIIKYGSRITHYPLQDFMNLQRFLGMVDINLAPLQNNDITQSKSELKYFEAGIVGTVTVASPTFGYANAIRDWQTGCLCDTSQWEEVLGRLTKSSHERATLAENARFDSEQGYAWYNQIDILKNALFPSC